MGVSQRGGFPILQEFVHEQSSLLRSAPEADSLHGQFKTHLQGG